MVGSERSLAELCERLFVLGEETDHFLFLSKKVLVSPCDHLLGGVGTMLSLALPGLLGYYPVVPGHALRFPFGLPFSLQSRLLDFEVGIATQLVRGRKECRVASEHGHDVT